MVILFSHFMKTIPMLGCLPKGTEFSDLNWLTLCEPPCSPASILRSGLDSHAQKTHDLFDKVDVTVNHACCKSTCLLQCGISRQFWGRGLDPGKDWVCHYERINITLLLSNTSQTTPKCTNWREKIVSSSWVHKAITWLEDNQSRNGGNESKNTLNEHTY